MEISGTEVEANVARLLLDADGTPGQGLVIGGVLSLAYVPKWSRQASDQIRLA